MKFKPRSFTYLDVSTREQLIFSPRSQAALYVLSLCFLVSTYSAYTETKIPSAQNNMCSEEFRKAS